ncbi:sigma 54 modulation/S30EA ribosomal C-terminal domain-containing protein, partial [Salmonella enterica]|uniref:sigma 54 modulation/S30EA ribosomal C-terminal domain-containing protein n=1 Tax=Salmonella enterica TaxID=28901 RepID=UPI003D287D37
KLRKNNHDRSIRENSSILGTKYVLNMPIVEEEKSQDHHEPITIAELQTNIDTLSVSEAIMKMDLEHVPALMFTNKLNNRI